MYYLEVDSRNGWEKSLYSNRQLFKHRFQVDDKNEIFDINANNLHDNTKTGHKYCTILIPTSLLYFIDRYLFLLNTFLSFLFCLS